MKAFPEGIQGLDDQALSCIHGGMFRGMRLALRGTPLNPGPDPYDLIRAQQQAEARRQFEALAKANPGLLAPPAPDWKGELLKQRIATQLGQLQGRKP